MVSCQRSGFMWQGHFNFERVAIENNRKLLIFLSVELKKSCLLTEYNFHLQHRNIIWFTMLKKNLRCSVHTIRWAAYVFALLL